MLRIGAVMYVGSQRKWADISKNVVFDSAFSLFYSADESDTPCDHLVTVGCDKRRLSKQVMDVGLDQRHFAGAANHNNRVDVADVDIPIF